MISDFRSFSDATDSRELVHWNIIWVAYKQHVASRHVALVGSRSSLAAGFETSR